MTYGAIVLCGGKSSRMGRDKASLPFGNECVLQRVVRVVGEVVPLEQVVCVAAVDQKLPTLPDRVRIAHDRQPDLGPLEGIAVGLTALGSDVTAAYVTSCDVPLLQPTFVRHMFDLLGEHKIVVPREGKFHHPLAAVYRTSVLRYVEFLLANENLRPIMLFLACKTLEVPVDELQTVDPDLHSLLNCNHPKDYEKALKLAGLA